MRHQRKRTDPPPSTRGIGDIVGKDAQWRASLATDKDKRNGKTHLHRGHVVEEEGDDEGLSLAVTGPGTQVPVSRPGPSHARQATKHLGTRDGAAREEDAARVTSLASEC